MRVRLYMLLTSNVLLLNVLLLLDNGLPKTSEGEFCTLQFSKTKIYKPQNNVFYSIAVTALPYISIGTPIKLFLILT